MKIKLDKIIELSVFSTIAIALHVMESFLNPTSFRIGFGNAVVLYLIMKGNVSSAFFTVLLKIAASGIITGSMLTPVFLAVSVASLSSFAVMCFFVKIPGSGPIGASVAASCLHNVIILFFADIIVRGIMSSLFPFVFAFSVFTGLITGTVTHILSKTLKNLDTKPDAYKITF